MARRFVNSLSLAVVLLTIGAGTVEATPIPLVNGDFETGTFAGWTLFTTVDGTLGGATVVPFDVDGDGAATNAARFQVGQLSFSPNDHQGGGIFQSFVSMAGFLAIDLDIASCGQGTFDNGSGGLFTLLLDSVAVDTLDFGVINAGATERATLSAFVPVVAGAHELRILMTRPFLTGGTSTPLQYVDDVRLDLQEVPEPTSLLLFGSGLLGAAASYGIRRDRSARLRG